MIDCRIKGVIIPAPNTVFHSLYNIFSFTPRILTTILAGLQCILPVLFQIWSQERRPLRSEL